MDLDAAREFIAAHPRAVLVTRYPDGGLQTSPVLVAVDGEGRACVSTRESAVKTRNLREDHEAVLCVLSDAFFGDWIQIEGVAEIVELPHAMEPLIEYYRTLSGEHPDWDDYRAAMQRERRVLLRIAIERAGPDFRG